MPPILDLLRLTFGPLHYEFHAHDTWGADMLARLRRGLQPVDFDNSPDRVIHLAARDFTAEEYDLARQGRLPAGILDLLQQHDDSLTLRRTTDGTGCLIWWHPDELECAWTKPHHDYPFEPPFQLPWQLLLDDIVRRNGAVLHGGLASFIERGYLFLAPAGGGKTTTLSRIPASWQVWGDDAMLIWPGPAGMFYASPLPTWSVVLGRNTALKSIGRWQTGRSIPVVSTLFLEKSNCDKVTALPPIDAVPLIYRAVCEHPRVLADRKPYRAQLFHIASALARATLNWDLQLTLAGQIWVQLESVLDQKLPKS